MVILQMIFVTILGCFCLLHAIPVKSEDGQYTNHFLVELHDGSLAEEVAREHGFQVEAEVVGFVVLKHNDVNHRSKRSAPDYVNRLKSDPRVKYADQQKELVRVKREIIHDKQVELPIKKILDNSIYFRQKPTRLERKDDMPTPKVYYNDPYYDDEWYIRNDGQTGGTPDCDLNLILAWKFGYTGLNVKVVVLDDGIDHNHPDLKDNFSPEISTDLNDKSDPNKDPMPDVTNTDNSHGTRCAGEIAAKANNKNCGVGIAHNCKIGGVRILDGSVTDALEAQAIHFKHDVVDIYSASWGPRDDGATMECPGKATIKAIEMGVKIGRKGKGNIFVWASGNGGGNDDDCNCDGYVGMPETISIGSINDHGERPYFMEVCPSTMAVVPSGGEKYIGEDGLKTKIKVVTTDILGGCTENFEGTSAAAPLAAGCIALMIEARPDLTYRDVQHIIAKGSRIPSVNTDWVVNGAGYHRSHQFGFGVLDCSLMVQLALGWQTVGEERRCNSSIIEVNMNVDPAGCVSYEVDMSPCQQSKDTHIEHLEPVLLYMEVDSNRRGAVSIKLTSPAETVSYMLSTRQFDRSKDGIRFRFMTLNSWGEKLVGEKPWKIEVCDNGTQADGNNVMFRRFWMEGRGTADHRNTRSTSAFQPSEAAVAEMEELELKRGKRLNLKRNVDGFKKSTESDKRAEEETEEDQNQQKFLKDTIKDLSKYLQRKGFEEDNILDILNHGMAYSAKERKSHGNGKGLISKRMFGEDDIDHEKFVDGISKAVNDILEKREEEKRKEMKEKREKMAERYLESLLDSPNDKTYTDLDKILDNVRKILRNRK